MPCQVMKHRKALLLQYKFVLHLWQFVRPHNTLRPLTCEDDLAQLSIHHWVTGKLLVNVHPCDLWHTVKHPV